MKHRLARWLRARADQLDPPHPGAVTVYVHHRMASMPEPWRATGSGCVSNFKTR